MTIYDIAALAGVSASTVSRVINKRPGIKAETRERVEKLLEEHSFSISDNARGLVNRSSMMIGILISDIRDQHYSGGAYLMIQEFLKAGYCSIILNSGDSPEERSNAIRICSRRRVDGVVMIGSSFSSEGVRRDIMRFLPDTPIVIENGSLDLDNVSSVLSDDARGADDAVVYLYGKGCRSFAYINANDTPSNRLKKEGFRRALERYSLKGVIEEASSDTLPDAEAAMEHLLERFSPDALICSVDLVAAGAMRKAQSLGLRIPEDLAVFGSNDSIYASLVTPSLSSICSRRPELSSIAASMLLESISGKGKTEKMLTPSLVIRESTP